MAPPQLLETGFALGATRLEMAGLLLRQALPGLCTALLLALGRGVGDAASVLFIAGYTDSCRCRSSTTWRMVCVCKGATSARLQRSWRRQLRAVGLWKEVKDRLKASATGLSGGQQQRLCLARTLAVRPEILLCDESTASLDPLSACGIEELLAALPLHHPHGHARHRSGATPGGLRRLPVDGRADRAGTGGGVLRRPPGRVDASVPVVADRVNAAMDSENTEVRNYFYPSIYWSRAYEAAPSSPYAALSTSHVKLPRTRRTPCTG